MSEFGSAEYWQVGIFLNDSITFCKRGLSAVCSLECSYEKIWRQNTSFLFELITYYMNNSSWDDDVNEPCLDAIDAVLKVGCYDKTSIPIGRKVPISATQKQSIRVAVPIGTALAAGDHDWHCQRLVPSVLQLMNRSPDPGDSLFSGGINDNGRTFVALHDATLNPSSRLKHYAHFFQFMKHHLDGMSMPYSVLMECDGGLDYNLTFLSNQVALLGILLVANIDMLKAFRCPGMSYLCMAERAMSPINMGILGLALALDHNSDEWLRKDVLAGESMMNGVRRNIELYDTEMPVAINILERQLPRRMKKNDLTGQNDGIGVDHDKSLDVVEGVNLSLTELTNEPRNEEDEEEEQEDEDEDITLAQLENNLQHEVAVGDSLLRFFPKYGW